MGPPPPVIEGALKNTINSIGFGLISTVLSITFGKLLLSNFFVCIVGFVVFLEVVLLSLPRKSEDYEIYRAPGKKVMHNIEGSIAPQISINAPDNEDSPKKRAGIRERFRKDKQGKGKDLLTPNNEGESPGQSGSTLSPKRSPKTERKVKEEAQKIEKAEKAEKEKAEKAKEKIKGKGDSVDNMTEGEEEKTKNNKGKGTWKKRLPHRKSQSLSDD